MMELESALELIERHRGDAIVIACQESRHAWEETSGSPHLDIPFAGCMGKGSSLGLGIALARPERKVIVLDGDGSLLMNLGGLATIAGKSPPNYYHFVVENGIYAGTGGQPIPNHGGIGFAGMAKAAGYNFAYDFDDLEDFALHVGEAISAKGPVFASLRVRPMPEIRPMSRRPRGRRLRDGLESVRDVLAEE